MRINELKAIKVLSNLGTDEIIHVALTPEIVRKYREIRGFSYGSEIYTWDAANGSHNHFLEKLREQGMAEFVNGRYQWKIGYYNPTSGQIRYKGTSENIIFNMSNLTNAGKTSQSGSGKRMAARDVLNVLQDPENARLFRQLKNLEKFIGKVVVGNHHDVQAGAILPLT